MGGNRGLGLTRCFQSVAHMSQNPDPSGSDTRLLYGSPIVARPWSGSGSGLDLPLQTYRITVERKHFTFALKENPRGRFLRITEEVSGRRDAIIIPLTGIDDFRDTLNEVIKFGKTLAPKL